VAASGSGAAGPDSERGPGPAAGPTDPPPPRQPKEGQVVGRKYRLDAKIGEGGMGAVYAAEHVHTGRRVAVKLLHPDRTQATDAARFMREARAASAVGHAAIVEVLDAGYHAGAPYVVYELLEGETLEEALKRDAITFATLRDLTDQVLGALHAAHASGIVHRDVKPENVFVVQTEEGPRAKLLDFGIAKTVEGIDTKLTVTGTVMGTPAFMAPEQASGKAVDGRADLWSVAASLYYATVGRPPFVADNYNVLIARILTQPPPDVRAVHPDLPEPFATVIERGLRSNPDDRVGTAREMASVLATMDDRAPWADASCTARDLAMPAPESLKPPPREVAETVDAPAEPDEVPATDEVEAVATPIAPRERPWWRSDARIGLAAFVVLGGLGVFFMGLSALSPGPEDTPADDPPPVAEPAAAAPAPEVEPEPEPEPEVEPEPEPLEVVTEPEEPAEAAPEPAATRRRRARPARRRAAPDREPEPRRGGFVIEREYE